MALIAPVQYVRPKIVASEGSISLLGARHPVMEFQDGMTFIGNDYKLVAVYASCAWSCPLLDQRNTVEVQVAAVLHCIS